MNTGLLVVSFGTTHLDTLEKTIAPTEDALRAAVPGAKCYRAFTSSIVRKRLLSKYAIHVDSVEEAVKRIIADGARTLLVQPTLLIPGEEYDKLCRQIAAAAGDMEVKMGKCLMTNDADLDAMIDLLHRAYPTEDDTVLLLMGHGTDHSANDLYLRLAEKMRARKDFTMRLCTVEGKPDFDDAVEELLSLPQRKVTLAPMLFVAGDHAKNDMAGEEPDSLHCLLEAKGFQVHCRIQGLGELEEVRQHYVKNLLQASVTE